MRGIRNWLISSTIVLSGLGCGGCERRQSGSHGSVEIYNRLFHYNSENGEIRHVIVFDKPNVFVKDGYLGGRERYFSTVDGFSFSMRYSNQHTIAIDGVEYAFSRGVVFLVQLNRNGNQCCQLPISFPHSADGPDKPDVVRAELIRAAQENLTLRLFLERE